MMERLTKDRLTAEQASSYLADHHGVRISPKALRNLMSRVSGPQFVLEKGEPLYTERHLDEFGVGLTCKLPLTDSNETKNGQNITKEMPRHIRFGI